MIPLKCTQIFLCNASPQMNLPHFCHFFSKDLRQSAQVVSLQRNVVSSQIRLKQEHSILALLLLTPSNLCSSIQHHNTKHVVLNLKTGKKVSSEKLS